MSSRCCPMLGLTRPSAGRAAGGCGLVARSLARCVVLGLALVCAPGALGARAANEPLVFLGDRDLPPWESLVDGEPRGAAVDLARAVGKQMGRPVEVRLYEWSDSQRRLLAGEGHALTQLGRTTEREAVFGFSRPTFSSAIALFVRTRDRDEFNADNLAGHRVGVTPGGIARVLLQRRDDVDLVLVPNLSTGTEMLLRGEIDALAAQTWAELHLLRERNITTVTHLPPFRYLRVSIAVRRDDAALLAEIDRALAELENSGEIDRILERWSPQRVFLISERIVRAVQGVGIGLALALAALVTATFVLARQRRRLGREVRTRRDAEGRALASGMKLGALQRLTAAMAAADEPQDVGRVFCEQVRDVTGAAACHVAEWNEASTRWLTVGLAGFDAAAAARLRPGPGDALVRALLDAPADGVRCHEVEGEEPAPDIVERTYGRADDLLACALTRNAAAAEGADASARVGVLVLIWDDTRARQALTPEQLEAVSKLLAQNLERTQLRRAERRMLAHDGLVHELTAALAGSPAADEIAVIVGAGAWRALGASQIAIAVPGADDDAAEPDSAAGATALTWLHQAALPAGWQTLLDDGSAGADSPVVRAARSGKPVFLNDRASVERELPQWRGVGVGVGIGVQALAAVPLPVVATRPKPAAPAVEPSAGVLLLAFDEPRAFDAGDRSFLQALADLAARSIERSRLAQRAADALRASRESELRLRLAALLTGMGTWDYDIGQGTMEWNSQMYALLGLPAGKGVEPASRFTDRVLAQDRAEIEQRLAKAADTNSEFEATFRIRRDDGQLRWVEGRGHAWTDEAAPRRRRIIGVTFDVTSFMRAQQDLESAAAQKDEFLAMLSHELRNPLAPIVYATQLLERAGDRAEIRQRAVTTLRQQGQQLSRLVDDLLEISRVRHGRLELQTTAVSVEEAIDAAVAGLAPQIDRHGHRLVRRTENAALRVRADPSRLIQMLTNLITNAVKYTPDGGSIAIEVAREPEQATQPAAMVRIDVTDNGVGIAADFLPQVFEVFKQADGVAGRSQGGLGLGLAIVKRLAELHGGRVHATSAGIGAGATFSLHLPEAVATPPA